MTVGGVNPLSARPVVPGAAPTMPYRVARAYGARPAALAAPAEQASASAPASPLRSPNVDRLVAGIAPGGIDFETPAGPAPSVERLAMYRHPADRNAAATGVSVGRLLDLEG
jgi:hypothetical protein